MGSEMCIRDRSHSLKAMMPMLLISIIVLFLITYVSPLTTLLPSIMAG